MESLLDNGDKHINREGDPDWSAHGVERGAIKRLDAQVLFDPAEESAAADQRQRYNAVMIRAGSRKLLVKKTKRR